MSVLLSVQTTTLSTKRMTTIPTNYTKLTTLIIPRYKNRRPPITHTDEYVSSLRSMNDTTI